MDELEQKDKVKEETTVDENNNGKENKNITLKCFEALEKLGIWILEKIHLNFIAKFYKEHIEGMRYLICGGLSTVVNIVAYAIAAYTIFSGIEDDSLRVTISDSFAFVVALIFAYWVNKTVVFNSKCENVKALIKEITSFTACRIVTQIISLGMMNLAVIIKMNDVLMKVIANIVVIILNFVFSKLIIFKKGKEE